MKLLHLVAMSAVLGMAACSPRDGTDRDEQAAANESPAASMTAAEAASLMTSMATPAPGDVPGLAGKWTGPEGTSMVITPAGDDFNVVITNLDGPRTFQGTAVPGGIAITRDGKALTIHRGDGADTGMKWLADKKDCLVVDANEGYCRD